MATYREFPAPGLACLWSAAGRAASTRVLPDACVDVIWSSVRGAFVAGPDTTAHRYAAQPGERLLGARFAPGTATAALGVPLHALRDTRVALDALAPALAADLPRDRDPREVEAVLRGLGRPRATVSGPAPASPTPGDRRVAAGSSAASDLVAADPAPPDGVVAAAVAALRDPRARVAALAGRLGVSERTLRRRCEAAVGYGPKHLQRVLRLQGFLAAAGDGDPAGDLMRLALDAGYADQSHLTGDCTRLTGLPPAALLRERGA